MLLNYIGALAGHEVGWRNAKDCRHKGLPIVVPGQALQQHVCCSYQNPSKSRYESGGCLAPRRWLRGPMLDLGDHLVN
jgi:hypothetical protein